MNLRPRRRGDPEINLTSLIDVVFLLLLFFILTTSFNRESALRIDLPKASEQAAAEEQKPIMLSIDAAGEFYVDGRQVVNTQVESVKRALRAALGERKDPPLIISADAKTQHQAVVTAMDAARQVGLIHLSIATKEPAGGAQ